MQNQDKPTPPVKDQSLRDAPLSDVGEALDGRHYLDVVEEQQYSGKPFVKKEQDAALGRGDSVPARNKTNR